MRRTTYHHRLLAPPLLLVIAAAALAVGGCKPPEELATQQLQATLEECKAAEGEFAEVEVFDGTKEPVLKVACEQPIKKMRVEDEIKASAKTGPYTWYMATNPDSGVWVVSGVEWREITDAKRVAEEEDPDINSLRSAIQDLESAERDVPESAWIKRERARLMLDVRKKTRNKAEGDVEQIVALDDRTQSYIDKVLNWAKVNDRPEVAARVRMLVVDYYRDYDGFVDMALESQGSMDEHLLNAIKLAEKEGRPDEAKQYQAELARAQSDREAERVKLEARQEEIKRRLCVEVNGLSAQGIKDAELKTQIVNVKKGIDCAG